MRIPRVTRRRLLVVGALLAAIASFEYVVLPQLVGLEQTWGRIRNGDARWLVVAAVFQALAFAAYVTLFRSAIGGSGLSLRWRQSYLIAMAGLVAARLFAAAGAGGIALTAWALNRHGMESQRVVSAMTSFLVVLYAVYLSALAVAGLGLWIGVLAGDAPFALTVPPAAVAAGAITAALAIALVPPAPGSEPSRQSSSRAARLADRARSARAAVAAGVREALSLVRARRPGLLGALGWWGFNILVLWACFRAFGDAPPGAVIVLAYFLGTLGNLLPLPGGVGGVEGGMIAAFIALGVEEGLAIAAVLAYRASSFWLPTIPGALAYLQLRRAIGDRRPA